MATTINTFSVGLTLDAADYINKASLSRTETRKLTRSIEQARTPAEKYSRELDTLTKAMESGAIELPTYNRLLEESAKRHGFATLSTERHEKETKRLAEEQERLIRVQREGEAVTKSHMSATERHRESIRKLSDLYRAGAINSETYKRGMAASKAALDAANPAMQQQNRLIAEGRQVTMALLSPMEKHERQLRKLNELHRAGAIDNVTYRRAVEQATTALNSQSGTAQKAGSSFGAMAGHLKAMVVGYVGFNTITKSIRLASEAESAAVSFEILTGSVNNAQVMVKQLRDFSDASPLTFGGVQDAAKLMLAFNVPVQEVMTNLKMLGDISLGNQQRFDSLTLAFSQMSAAGRLMGQDLLQMINAGFNPLQEISKKTGESLTELRKRMEEGKISSQEITEAFASATGEGGKFNGMTERLSDTMGGRLAIAMANLEKAGVQLGEKLSPVITGLTDGFNEGASIIQVMVQMVEELVDGLSFIVNVFKDLGSNTIASLTGGDRSENRFGFVNAQLDAMDKRDRERAQALETEALIRMRGGKQELDQAAAKGAALDKHASVGEQMTDDYEKALAAINQQVIEIEKGVEFARKAELAAAGYSEAQIRQIMNQEKYLDKLKEQQELEKKLAKDKEDAEKDRLKEIEKLKKAAEDAFTKDVENSLKAAHEYFANQAARDTKMREQISQGIGGDFEVGGSESQKFFADQQNAAIGAAAIPERPTPGEAEIINEAKRIFAEEQKIKAEQHRQQLAATAAIAAAIKDNGFKRLR